MIELIVAIVVIGITFMSVPLIMSETERSVETSVHQEAVMAGLSQMVNIMSYKWDENQTDESLNGGYAKVLDTFYTNPLQCREISGTRMRIGHFQEDYRRKCYNEERNATAPANLGSDGGDMDDIDDINYKYASLLSGTDNNESDYKQNYNIKISVVYVEDDLSNGNDYTPINIIGTVSTTSVTTEPTSIKMIETTISSDTSDTKVVMRSFAANVGEVRYFSKRVGP